MRVSISLYSEGIRGENARVCKKKFISRIPAAQCDLLLFKKKKKYSFFGTPNVVGCTICVVNATLFTGEYKNVYFHNTKRTSEIPPTHVELVKKSIFFFSGGNETTTKSVHPVEPWFGKIFLK